MQRLLITDMAKIIQDKTLTDIADAIRSKTNTTDTMKPTDMPAKINSITTGITPTGSITLTENTKHYDVSKYADAYTSIAVDYNLLLRYLMQGNQTYYDDEMWGTERVTDCLYTIFYRNSSLYQVNLPEAETLAPYAFEGCSSLTQVHIPKVKLFRGNKTFSGCTSLTEFIHPIQCNYTGDGQFYNCTSLTKVDIYIDLSNQYSRSFYDTFRNCTSLETLIIRNDVTDYNRYGYPSMNTTMFNNTPIETGTGYIYVPQATIEGFKSATNWSDYADQFRAIEDYPDICAIPEEYQ